MGNYILTDMETAKSNMEVLLDPMHCEGSPPGCIFVWSQRLAIFLEAPFVRAEP